ncbi:XdhC family aldehyde oxidoreductase maturation factor [Desulfoluna spongiiphila]|uniref:Xanthine dehydrogenase accessory factor n=1 Tax=Desulfoluna spongiiphila TaxID=419481 RepID=A0A1G5E1X3_9BACT|nr:XdhC/CoxI family protein [Desulfoluna spongiiphila]SCY21009.1 xanthine dehydrogenase accessory factor [Desulfoluna spongiiphila]
MEKIEKEICTLIERNESFVMATILSQTGSTPRLPGTRMLIRKTGDIIGTIGGGLVEAQAMAAAPGLFKKGGALIASFDLNTEGIKEGMDMICGGEMEVLMEVVTPSEPTLAMFSTFLTSVAQGAKAVLVADISGVDNQGGTVRRCLYTAAGSLHGDTTMPLSTLKSLLQQTGNERSPSIIRMETGLFLAEPAFSSGTVYLFGAGHVSRQVARLTHMVGFRTIVMDDRAEFANTDRFETAEAVIVTETFDDCLASFSMDEESYIVILTRGHSHDQTVLEQAIRTEAGYIGMIGSRKKRTAIYESMIEKGYSQEALETVHSPIGIAIGGETPEEIAVSIVAELIKERSSKA